MIAVPSPEDQARQDALLAEYLSEPPPETREAWLAALSKWEGKVNIESLLVWGDMKGWKQE